MWTVLLLAAPSGCGGDAIVTLGQGEPLPRFRDQGQRVAVINEEDEEEDNPTLTEDLLEIYFTSSRPGEPDGPDGANVWYATRATRADPFDEPQLVLGVNSDDEETSPAISSDGLTLYLASNREAGSGEGDNDIWRTTRPTRSSAWGPLDYVLELNSEFDDIPRPLALGGLAMPMASRRDGPEYQSYVAARPSRTEKFDTPAALVELWVDGTSMVDAFMTEDGLMIFFKRGEDDEGEDGDLYVAWRASLDERFGEGLPLQLVNSVHDDRDPWLSADGKRFFFSSDRRDNGGGYDIYATIMELPSFDR